MGIAAVMKWGGFVVALSLALVGAAPSGHACSYQRPTPGIPDRDGTLYDTPIYDPDSKSYFALIWARTENVYRAYTWDMANKQAVTRQYKGVHGHLAVVDSVEVHEFLQHTFHTPCETWIGLRYWCGPRSLQWVDSHYWKPGSFAAWDANWKQDVYACAGGKTDYMPVAYEPVAKGFRWIGKGVGKEYAAYFIEFPTGHQ
jgi:hypothetical protein